MRSLRKRGSPEGAFTMVELAVTMSIMVLISGLILGILVNTRRSTKKAQTRLAMQIKAERIADNIVSVLQTSVRPSALDAPAGREPVFAAHKCSFLHSKRFLKGKAKGKGLEWVEIQTLEDGQNDENPLKTVAIRHEPLATPSGASPAAKLSAPVSFDKRFSVTVDFKYAVDGNAVGLTPNFKDGLEAREYPRLIQVRVKVEDAKKKLDPYELVTAVRMM